MNFVTFGTTRSIANINYFIWVMWNITCMKKFLKYYSRRVAKSLMPQHSSGFSFCEKHLMFGIDNRWPDRWGKKFVESTFKLALEESHFGTLSLTKNEKWWNSRMVLLSVQNFDTLMRFEVSCGTWSTLCKTKGLAEVWRKEWPTWVMGRDLPLPTITESVPL